MFGIALPLEPGAHELLVSAPGFEARAFQVQLSEGQAQTLLVSPGNPRRVAPSAPVTTATTATLAPASAEPAPAAHSRRLGFALGGVGVAGLGLGAVAGLIVLGKQHTVDTECHPDKSCTSAGVAAASSGHTWQVVSNVGWVLGAAALGAGAYLLLSSAPSTQPNTSLSVSSTVAGAEVSLNRSF